MRGTTRFSIIQLIPNEKELSLPHACLVPIELSYVLILEWVYLTLFVFNDNNFVSDSNITINRRLRLISRLQWLAQPPIEQPNVLKTPVSLVIIQHTATVPCASLAQCIFQVKVIQKYHIESNGWWDIGYNFLTGGDGAAYEGRGWTQEGAHTLGYNNRSIGVGFIGTFTAEKPPKSQIVAFKKLIDKGVDLGYITKDYKILGARQLYGTESPGTAFFKRDKDVATLGSRTMIGFGFFFGDENNKDLFVSDLNTTVNGGLRILSRVEWLAQPPTKLPVKLKTPVLLIIIHHTSTASCRTEGECIYIVRNIQQFHVESRQLWDIGYNFLVGGDGSVYEGRGWEREGAHTFEYNYLSIGVAFVGTFTTSPPPENQTDTFNRLVAIGVKLGYLRENYKIMAASQLESIESPGAEFVKEMQKWPHWSKNL
ncbi:hypothetical protein NQ318_009690 [Aromia moschata]|uniref:Peptidoglycan recognition protein n=1 Tax=Aromia moschata TaxID=1265417 RepID=A0AAV8X7J8_9CUCU|nr:hypothetical protein NQ318_009690 [Aromia moschata]